MTDTIYERTIYVHTYITYVSMHRHPHTHKCFEGESQIIW